MNLYPFLLLPVGLAVTCLGSDPAALYSIGDSLSLCLTVGGQQQVFWEAQLNVTIPEFTIIGLPDINAEDELFLAVSLDALSPIRKCPEDAFKNMACPQVIHVNQLNPAVISLQLEFDFGFLTNMRWVTACNPSICSSECTPNAHLEDDGMCLIENTKISLTLEYIGTDIHGHEYLSANGKTSTWSRNARYFQAIASIFSEG